MCTACSTAELSLQTLVNSPFPQKVFYFIYKYTHINTPCNTKLIKTVSEKIRMPPKPTAFLCFQLIKRS